MLLVIKDAVQLHNISMFEKTLNLYFSEKLIDKHVFFDHFFLDLFECVNSARFSVISSVNSPKFTSSKFLFNNKIFDSWFLWQFFMGRRDNLLKIWRVTSFKFFHVIVDLIRFWCFWLGSVIAVIYLLLKSQIIIKFIISFSLHLYNISVNFCPPLSRISGFLVDSQSLSTLKLFFLQFFDKGSCSLHFVSNSIQINHIWF